MILVRLSGLFLLMFLCTYAIAKPELSLTTSTAIASEGYLTLSWGATGGRPSERPHSATLLVFDTSNLLKPLRIVELHDQTQVHLSGFEDGNYSAILHNNRGQPLSNTIDFTVRHHSLKTAFVLFFFGLVLFAGLLLCVFIYTRQTDGNTP